MASDAVTSGWEGRAYLVERWSQDQVEWAATHLGVTPERVTSAMLRALLVAPDSEHEPAGHNVLLDQGKNAILHLLCDTSIALYNAANGYIGVGDGTTAATAAQTGLQGANTAWRAFNAANPVIAAGTTVTTMTIAADFASGVAEWGGGWQEWAVGNANTGGRVLNRAVDPSLGTGKSSELWTLNAVINLLG